MKETYCFLKYMADTKILFQLCFLLLTHFNFTIASKAISVPEQWDCLKSGWPIEDKIDYYNGTRSQFFYNKDSEKEIYDLTIKKSFINEVEKKYNYFKLSFKFWFRNETVDRLSDVYVNYQPNFEDFLLARHKLDFENKWMPCEYVLNFKNLDSFKIQVMLRNINSTLAFKDFKMEYDKISDDVQNSIDNKEYYIDHSTKDVESGFVNSYWHKYTNPPKDDSKAFFYFSDDCYISGCELTFFPKFDRTIKKDLFKGIENAELEFQLWARGDVSIDLFKQNEINSTSKIWQYIKLPLDKNQYNKTVMIIKTTRMAEDKISFVAIKNIKMIFHLNIKDGKDPYKFNCPDQKECEIKSSRKLLQTVYKSHLTDGTTFYYPISENNSMEYHDLNDINENNVCFAIDYVASKYKISTVNVFYIALEDNTGDKIISFKPKVYTNDVKKERFEFCLRDYLSLNSKNYSLKFVVSQPNYEEGIDGFAMKVSGTVHQDHWNFESFTFLQGMQKSNKEGENNLNRKWQDQWKTLSLSDKDFFSMEDETVKFTAIASSEIPTTAQIMSKWIKNDDLLANEYSEYQLTSSNKSVFEKVIVRPKICDWLSQCYDVILEPIDKTSDTMKNYRFKFIPLKNSKYIKLLFEFEYHKIEENKENELINLNLTLKHFGDPCFKDLSCNGHGDCFSDSYNSIPNQPICSCFKSAHKSYTGKECEIEDKCNTVLPVHNMTGKKFCKTLLTQCENLVNGKFRCICGVNGSEKIIWDEEINDCTEVKTPQFINWSDTLPYSPLEKNNSLIYNFKNINNETMDICAMFEITANERVNIEFLYIDKEIHEDTLFDIPISSSTEKVEFCVRDFRLSIFENFKLVVKVKTESDVWKNGTFSLNQTLFYIGTVNEPLKYIAHWDHWKTHKSSGDQKLQNPSQYWNFFPKNLFTPHNDSENSESFSIDFNDTLLPSESSKAFIISDWINHDSNFFKSENIFAVLYAKGLYNNNFKLKQVIIVERDRKINRSSTTFINTKENPFDHNFVISPQKFSNIKPDSNFKIMIEIQYYSQKDPLNLKLTFKSLSFGDPCYKDNEPICKNDLKCIASGPNNYYCNCTGTNKGGRNCDIVDPCQDKAGICETMPSIPNQKSNCSITEKNGYICDCPKGYYLWDSKRCLRNPSISKYKICEGSNCDFLNIDNGSHWSYKNLPGFMSTREYSELPLYFPKKNGAKYNIELKSDDIKKYACLNLNFSVSGNSRLDFNFNDDTPFGINPTKQNKFNIWSPQSAQFCIRDWSKSNNSKGSITLTAVIGDVTKDMIAFHYNISYKIIEEKLLGEIPFLTHWSGNDLDKAIKGNFAVDNQWPIAFPENNWNKLKEENSIRFKILGKDTIKQSSFLISKWLAKEASENKLRFNLMIKNSFKGFVISVLVFDDKMKSTVHFSIGDKNAIINVTDNLNIQIPKQKSSFRIAFKVDYNSSMIENDSYLFSLNSINLGDPCFNEEGILNDCNGKHGICKRNFTLFKYECDCFAGFRKDEDCKYKEWCDFINEIPNHGSIKGNELCKLENTKYSKGCLNVGDHLECDCANKTTWDSIKYKCVQSPQCIVHDCNNENQICEEPLNPEGEPTCICDKSRDFYNVSKTKDLNCVKYDPCNESHRNVRKEDVLRELPCGKYNATCVSFGSGPTNYTCICPEGFKNSDDRENTVCKAQFCSFPSWNTCEQICKDEDDTFTCSCNENFYELKGSKCINKEGMKCNCTGNSFCSGTSGECACKNGYIFDIKNKVCKPDLTVSNNICPYQTVTYNSKNELVCFCGDAYKLNDKNQCDLKPICGENGEGRKDCNLKNALCMTNLKDLGKYDCLCTPGMDKDDNQKCVDKCELNNRKEKCAANNAICNPLDVIDKDDNTTYCSCRPGFVMVKGICLMESYAQEISLSIKDTFTKLELKENSKPFFLSPPEFYQSNVQLAAAPYTHKLALELKSMNEENDKILSNSNFSLNYKLISYLSIEMEGILSNISNTGDKLKVSVEKCSLNSHKFYDCIFTITSESQNQNLSDLLVKHCRKTVNDPKICFFPDYSKLFPAPSSKLFSLALDLEKLKKNKFVKYQPCDKSRRAESCPKFTLCHEDNQTSLFWCTCDEKYFTSDNQIQIPVNIKKDKEKYVKHICKVRKDICEAYCPLKKENGNCIETVPEIDKDNNWLVKPYCSCDDGYILSNNSKQCSGVCVNQNCNNHGSCKIKGSSGFACECKEGWGGENCEKEYKNGVGGWIAGIVVLAVLVVIAAGVALIFARRARRTDYINHSGEPLDEYSRTSYRTQPGTTGSRNLPAHQGRDNQAYHRD